MSRRYVLCSLKSGTLSVLQYVPKDIAKVGETIKLKVHAWSPELQEWVVEALHKNHETNFEK